MAAPEPGCQLYLITPPVLDPDAFAPVFEAALDAAPVACVQLRLKGVSDDDILRAGERLMPLAEARGAAFLINDRPDLAKTLGADGAHIGQDDMPYEDARALLGPERILGVTCHDSRHLAMEAGERGADYVAFGSVFATGTKEAKSRADLDLFTWWSALFEVPCVAIGGITVENAASVIRAGADFLAVCAGVWQHPKGAPAAVTALDALCRTQTPPA